MFLVTQQEVTSEPIGQDQSQAQEGETELGGTILLGQCFIWSISSVSPGEKSNN